MQIDDLVPFDPDCHFLYNHTGIRPGSIVKITGIGQPYWYYGLPKNETTVPVDFVVVETGKQYTGFSSEYFQSDGCDL